MTPTKLLLIKNCFIFLILFLFFIATAFTTAPELQSVESDFFTSVTKADVNRSISGYLSGRYTSNYYEIDMPSEGYIRIDFEHEKFEEDDNAWRITLFDYEQNEIYRFSSNLNEEKVSSPNIGLDSDIYYVRIDRPITYTYSDEEYTLRVNHTESRRWEQEPNDTALNATSISLNRTYNGTLHSRSDIDFYTFEMPESGEVSIYFEHETVSVSGYGWRITLMHRDSSRIESFSSQLKETGAFLEDIHLDKDYYYIRVDNPLTHAHSSIDYHLTIRSDQRSPQEQENDEKPEPVTGSQPGDINNDGRVNIQDAVLVIQSILGYESLSADQRERADVDGNGRIDVNDANLIMQMTLGNISRFPVE